MLGLKWNADKPFSMAEPPADMIDFLKNKRQQALTIGVPGAAFGGALTLIAAAINQEVGAALPTLGGVAVFGVVSALVNAFGGKLFDGNKK